MEHLDAAFRPDASHTERVAVVDDFAAYGASLAAALGRCGISDVVRFDSHDAALGSGQVLASVDLVFVDVYRHAAERAADPYLPGIGVMDIAHLLADLRRPPRLIVYGSWADRPEVRLLVADLPHVEALYDSGTLLDRLPQVLRHEHTVDWRPTDQDRRRAGVGPAARIVEAVTVAQSLGAEPGEPFGDVWRLVCDLDVGQEARRAAGVSEAVRRAIGRRIVPLLDLGPEANYLDAIRVLQRLAQVGPR